MLFIINWDWFKKINFVCISHLVYKNVIFTSGAPHVSGHSYLRHFNSFMLVPSTHPLILKSQTLGTTYWDEKFIQNMKMWKFEVKTSSLSPIVFGMNVIERLTNKKKVVVVSQALEVFSLYVYHQSVNLRQSKHVFALFISKFIQNSIKFCPHSVNKIYKHLNKIRILYWLATNIIYFFLTIKNAQLWISSTFVCERILT